MNADAYLQLIIRLMLDGERPDRIQYRQRHQPNRVVYRKKHSRSALDPVASLPLRHHHHTKKKAEEVALDDSE